MKVLDSTGFNKIKIETYKTKQPTQYYYVCLRMQ